MSIVLVEHRAEWECLFESMKAKIVSLTQNASIVDIQHVGSTAVEGLYAKPIVDIAIGLRSFAALPDVLSVLDQIGYVPWHSASDRITVQLRDNEDVGIHQVHLVIHNSSRCIDQLYFRDYLRTNEQAKNEYAKLKLALAAKHTDTRIYSEEKTPFIRDVLKNRDGGNQQ
ncbi:MAG: hypothetical protein GKR90_27370 [Pseudomonadales bacterium]|nr:hypothetical protein [Pseudomonadales bacterium]